MERIHIAIFGPANSGKSSLVNALAGQQVSLVTPIPGTTTDPVRKLIELPRLGPCVLIDTAGYDDESTLGAERQRLSEALTESTDIAVVMLLPETSPGEQAWLARLRQAAIPFVPVAAKADLLKPEELAQIHRRCGETPVAVCTRDPQHVARLLERLIALAPAEEAGFFTGDLIRAGDTVLLVMPQDSEAPKGRLILPQVQVIRELLDRKCNALCCTPDSLAGALATLKHDPALVVTDSQVFEAVEKALPESTPLTSFSVLLAAAKGDMRLFVEGAQAIRRLDGASRVLIAEACTHVPDTEDIGRVKIPTLLRAKAGAGLTVDISAGNDFPEELTPYDLVIHCGACMAGRQVVRARTRKALLSGVPITNYGIALAELQGILGRIVIPGLRTPRRSS